MSPEMHDHHLRVDASRFPQLREFLRAYFHEDWVEVHGSVQNAVEQFCSDAGKQGTLKLAEEWERFYAISGGDPGKAAELLGRLGGAWNPTGRHELEQLDKALARCKSRVEHT
jgi:hypothetical protein